MLFQAASKTKTKEKKVEIAGTRVKVQVVRNSLHGDTDRISVEAYQERR